jgi:hypothetical protein
MADGRRAARPADLPTLTHESGSGASRRVAHAETTGVAEIVSFDRSIDRIPNVSRREP